MGVVWEAAVWVEAVWVAAVWVAAVWVAAVWEEEAWVAAVWEAAAMVEEVWEEAAWEEAAWVPVAWEEAAWEAAVAKVQGVTVLGCLVMEEEEEAREEEAVAAVARGEVGWEGGAREEAREEARVDMAEWRGWVGVEEMARVTMAEVLAGVVGVWVGTVGVAAVWVAAVGMLGFRRAEVAAVWVVGVWVEGVEVGVGMVASAWVPVVWVAVVWVEVARGGVVKGWVSWVETGEVVGESAVEEARVDSTQGGSSPTRVPRLKSRMCLPTLKTSATNVLMLRPRQLRPPHHQWQCWTPLVLVCSSSGEAVFPFCGRHQT